ncbi:MAG TPA: DUF1549 and DUF1553 domain-containing protein [Pirellulaceae bacterium]|nr:DUF1549 and DUF1553 domain-containing protein [Pirellulaceae bacterium]
MPRVPLLLLAIAALVVAGVTPALAADRRVVLLPSTIALSSREARQTLVVQWQAGEQFQEQATPADVEFSTSNDKVVKVEEGVATAVGNGEATITARVGNQAATASVAVKNFDEPFAWSFRNHVESVLSKQGCNAGACHGARAGQKGFRLTLFGFDVDADYTYLTRQAVGRRIVPTDPGRSLILTKPTGLLPHKGGVRLEPGSLEYRVLSEWIASGVPGPKAGDPQIERVEVLPKYSLQSLGKSQQLVVLAHFSDGHVEDATRWAKYTSVQGTVAAVDERGKVSITGAGEAAVKVWYLNHNAMAFLTVPFPNEVRPKVFAQAPRRNFIDELVLAKLQALRVPPSPRCTDAEFLRRAYLDTIGTLPTADEAREFLDDTAADKRDRLIDELLGRPEFVDYWTYRWSDLLLLSGERLRPKSIETYYAWIRERVARNQPWDEFVKELVTASGSTHENGAANFFALHQDPEGMAETVAQAFMGLSINCAKCHNHPLEKWTNDQYYSFANMFSRVRAKGWGGDFRNGDGNRVVYTDTQGELIQPSRGVPQPPAPLDGQPLAFEATADRRLAVAEWLASSDNPYFTRAIVNRVWANFFGVGLVEAVDDLRLTNPASNEELLNAAARHLIAHRYNLKELMRTILESETYQRTSQPLPENQADERFYSRYYPRRLKAEVLLDAISQVTAVPTDFKAGTPDSRKPGPALPKIKRALHLPDGFVESYFLSAFGKPDRLITCECERSNEPSMTQVLHLYNGDTVNQKLAKPGSAAEKALAEVDNKQIVESLYLAALSRLPTEKESASLVETLSAAPVEERRQAIEDLHWSVLTSREFLFNH